MGILGTGHYPEDAFEQKIYDQGIDQDRWIEDSNYKKLIQQLQAVNFQVNPSRERVADLINYVDKDLPANPGVRFPGARGTLDTTSYHPIRFARGTQSLKAHFVALISIANQVNPCHVMANRPRQPIVAGAGSAQAHDQRLREGALNYDNTLGIVATTVVETKLTIEVNLNATLILLGFQILVKMQHHE
ncbi:hypothetical protein AgCh_022013 [Apium graveolens]